MVNLARKSTSGVIGGVIAKVLISDMGEVGEFIGLGCAGVLMFLYWVVHQYWRSVNWDLVGLGVFSLIAAVFIYFGMERIFARRPAAQNEFVQQGPIQHQQEGQGPANQNFNLNQGHDGQFNNFGGNRGGAGFNHINGGGFGGADFVDPNLGGFVFNDFGFNQQDEDDPIPFNDNPNNRR